MTQTLTQQPYRGDGTDRPQDVPLPPDWMAPMRGGRLLKTWRYVSVWGSELSLCAGIVHVGPVYQEFWAVWDRAGQKLAEHTRMLPGTVKLNPGSVRVDDGDVHIDLVLPENTGFQVVTPDGEAYTWTRKQMVRAQGTVSVAGRTMTVDAPTLIDDNAGYHPRHTLWRWSGGAGTSTDGRAVAWSVIVGLNDSPQNSERTVWIDGVDHEIGPVSFADDLSAVTLPGGHLQFTEEATRTRKDNLLLLRSSYRQPFGTFTGTLPGGITLAEAHGVMEWHEAYW